jgi:hypothetical protein
MAVATLTLLVEAGGLASDENNCNSESLPEILSSLPVRKSSREQAGGIAW